MSEAGSDSEGGPESPIFGFSSGVHEHKKDESQSFCATNPNLKMESSEESGGSESAGPSNGKAEELMPPPQLRGFSTASGKIIPVSEKALQIAKKKMELMDGWVDAVVNDGPLSENEKTSQETMPVPQFKGLFTASGKSISVSKKAIEAAKKMNYDDFRKENIQLSNATSVSCTNTTFVFDNENQRRLSPEESNEVEDCTRLLLEDISADDETEWDEVDMQQDDQLVNPVTEPEKIIVPAIDVRKAQTSTKRPNLDPPDLLNSSNPAKHGRITKKFVPPPRKDNK